MNALIVDDLVDIVDWFRDAAEEVFGQSSVVYCQHASRAERDFQSRNFDMAFVDLMLKKADKEESESVYYAGIQIASRFKKISPETVVILYSANIREGAVEKFPYYKQCVESGADCVISREELFSMPGTRLKHRVDDWIRKRDERLKEGVSVSFDESIRTKALIERVGRSELERLVQKCFSRMKLHKVTAMKAGFSGSLVCRVESQEGAEGGLAQDNILKIAKSTFSLADEFRRKPFAGTGLGALGRGIETNVQRVGEWAGAGIPRARNAESLVSYIESNRNSILSKQRIKVIENVIQKTLVEPCSEAAEVLKQYDSRSFELSYVFVSQISEVLRDMESWSPYVEGRYCKLSKLISFLERVLNNESNWGIGKRRIAKLHGDFHCENVFVSDRGDPIVIDFGRSDYYPRLFDFSALDADLVLSRYDCSNGKCFDFSLLKFQLKRALNQFPFCDKPVADTSDLFLQCRSVCIGTMFTEVVKVTPEEYGECLLMHLLRYLRFDIGPVKKLLAANLCEQLLSKFKF